MKTYYTVVASFMNGTVTMFNDISSYTSEELAEKVKDKNIKTNKNSTFPAMCNIQVTNVYESEDEVPILNNHNETEDCRKDI